MKNRTTIAKRLNRVKEKGTDFFAQFQTGRLVSSDRRVRSVHRRDAEDAKQNIIHESQSDPMMVNEITKEIIGAAIEVHRLLGPGLLESAYERCLCRELTLRKGSV